MPNPESRRPVKIFRPQPSEIEEARKKADEALKSARELLKLPIYPP